ncbi:MAG: hypothetical protein ACPIEY_07920 [Candidatus Poseidoniaceae archaeon]
MFPHQPTWSNTRINLLQRCPRAFVLRYGLAKLSQHHPQGKLLTVAFQIQTPWVLMHQTIRQIVLDYIEDYVNGTIWTKGLLRARFKSDYGKAMKKRSHLIRRLHSFNIQTSFHSTEPETHLIDMGVEACLKLIERPDFIKLLKTGSIERIEPTKSILYGNIRVYCTPDFIHYGSSRTSLIKLNLYGKPSRIEQEHQASLLTLHGSHEASVIQFSLKQRIWTVKITKPVKSQMTKTITLMKEDTKQMESIFSQVGTNNDLSLVPLADSYRSCMNCNVRFLCPARYGYENAKAEQRAMMCQ